MQSITDSYCLGIKEGRELLKNCPDIDLCAARLNAIENMRRHSGTMHEIFKGQRDFWNNQIKKRGK